MDDSPLLNQTAKQPLRSRIKNYLSQDVSKARADLVLIIACFISGLVDSAVFNVWSCFVSMQTGNTVYVGLGISHQPLTQPYRWAKSGTAILSFCLGTYTFSRLSRLLGPLYRSTLSLSFLTQSLLCFAAAILVTCHVVPPSAGDQLPDNNIVLLPLALLSFQSAGQIVASRLLAFNELPTVVLTSTYCDLMFDPLLFSKDNVKRNRRAASVVALVVGAGLGGIMTKGGSVAGALWVAGAVKVFVAMGWVGWKGEEGGIRI
ncbi:hypothetical protein AJ79_07015 [Helicocarpus griseus UAMH5409]|uniref:DUF1275 domain-containing protein n=1 Tax=Helicocarpus griseus UAMH5409 TaxID=1447875 RepID=A0A2B7X6P1_9EURO|nr:hypothetical protein AJ79_07015 [Helicocarpus griseus UAMH5409]